MTAQGGDQDEIFWGRVSQRMGGKRGRQQCRVKWSGFFVQLKEVGSHHCVGWINFSSASRAIVTRSGGTSVMHIFSSISRSTTRIPQRYLMQRCRIDSLNIQHDSEIDWKSLPDPSWNIWSPHLIQLRWRTMKESVKGWEHMSHAGELTGVACSMTVC